MSKCIDCQKDLNTSSKWLKTLRCHSCENKRRHNVGFFNSKGKNNPNYKTGKSYKQFFCKICINPISRSNVYSGQKMCRCCMNQIRGFNQRKIINLNCIDCGKPISLASYYGNKRCQSCHAKNLWKLHIFKIKKGKNHPSYIDGRTKIQHKIRNQKIYSNWVKKCFWRDNYTCQLCGQRGGNLNVHHKLPLATIVKLYRIKNWKQAQKCKLLWDINWGITLCRKCHETIDIQLRNSKFGKSTKRRN